IGKSLAQDGSSIGTGIDRKMRLRELVEAAQLVEPAGMVGVGMGEKHRVNLADAEVQRLEAELGGGVDEQMEIAPNEIGGGAVAEIARISGRANVALATDHGHAVGGAGTKECEGEHRKRRAVLFVREGPVPG